MRDKDKVVDAGSDKISEAIESKFRDASIEMEVAAFLCRKNTSMTALVEPEWWGSQLLANIITVVKDVKTHLSRTALMRELKRRGLMSDDELTYDCVLDELYEVNVDKLTEKGVLLSIHDLLDMSESRRVLYEVRDMIGTVRAGKFRIGEAKELLRELGTPVYIKNDTTSGEYLEGYEKRVTVVEERRELRDSGKEVGVLTGVGAFDRMIGGVMKREFGVIAGKPSVGKTAALVSFGVNAWQLQGRNVLFVSGEMSKIDIEFRMDSMIAGVSAGGFRTGSVSDAEMEKWRKAVERERSRRDNFLETVSFPKGFTMDDVEAEALRVQDKHKSQIDLVVLDYINILYPKTLMKGRSSKDWSAQSDAVWEFKDFCAEFNGGVAGWTAGQLVDTALDSDVLTLADLKYSRSISETAPIVVGLVQTDRAEVEHALEMQILKMRNAKLPSTSVVLRPRLEYMRIHEDVLGIKDLRLLGCEVTPRRERKARRKS